MALELLHRWSSEGLLLESPAEQDLAGILESGPGTNVRAVFARAITWRDGLLAVAGDPTCLARSQLIIFPQVTVSRFRTDFMVVCADVSRVVRSAPLSHFAFFVECDGLKGHAESARQVMNDYERERAIRAETGLSVLRFSGAEVMFQRGEVDAVIGAQVHALAALREHGTMVARQAESVLEAVGSLSCHRGLRSDYTARNARRSNAEPYDPTDPFGDDGLSAEDQQEARWDAFLSLRICLAKLNHAVGYARQGAPCAEYDEYDGDVRPFHEALVAVVEASALKFLRPD